MSNQAREAARADASAGHARAEAREPPPAASEREDSHPQNPDNADWAGLTDEVVGIAPAFAMGLTYVAAATSLGRMFSASVSAQRNLEIVAQDATVAGSRLLLGLSARKKRATPPAPRAGATFTREQVIELLERALELAPD